MTTAALIVIGNEILSAKTADENGPFLARELRALGVELRRVETVPDEVPLIVDSLVRCKQAARWVFTSGGIGPTHDDVTVRAVALALGRKVVRLEEMVRRIRDHYGEGAAPAAFRMADAPEGAELWAQEGSWYPVLTCDGVHMLPGVPQLFRHQLETVLARLPGAPVHVRSLYLRAGEAEIAGALDAVALDMPQVSIGSYPSFDRAIDYSVKVTIEHADQGPVEEVLDRLRRTLPEGSILRVE